MAALDAGPAAAVRLDGFIGEMKAGRAMRVASILALVAFLSLAVAPLYLLTYGAPHLLAYALLFHLCDRAAAEPAVGRRARYIDAATALRFLMVLHTCWAALDLRFGHHLKAEGTLLLTAATVMAAMQTQPSRTSYLLNLAPPFLAMLLVAAYRPIEDIRVGVATLLLLLTVLTTATRQHRISRRALSLQAKSDEAALALQDALAAAELADDVARIGHWRLGPGEEHNWSPGVFRIFGLPVADAPPPVAEAMAFYREDDRERIGAIVAEAQSERRGFSFEHTIVRNDGEERTLLVKARFVAVDETAGYLLGVVQDVTEQRAAERLRQESEARYRLIAENAGDMIVQGKLSGRITYISPACFGVTGYTPEELIGRSILDFMLEEDQPIAERRLKEALAARSPEPWRLEYRVRRKDGAVVWLECHPRLSFDENGRPVGLVDVVRDANARKTMERDLVYARQAAEAGAKTKADFLANMSHELRTPLNSIVGFSKLIAAAPELTAETRRRASLVHEASRSLVVIVNDVLDMSRIESEGVVLRPEAVEVGHLASSVIELVREEAESRGLQVTVRTPAEPVRVMVDPVRLRQVLLNLVGNAVKFTERGSVVVAVEREGPERLRFRVVDTGVGIPANRQAAVFQRFAQADGSTARRFGGSGLGLTICQSIVEAMGGEIGVESVERDGSTFWFVISPPAAPETVGAARADAPDIASMRGTRVLLADDNPMNRDLFAALLEGSGLDIRFAENGAEAIHAVKETPFDLVFMDVQMPVMDGFEAAKAIRALGFDQLPIVALTANVLQPQIDACLAAGMNAHLGKPFHQQDILACLTEWTEPAAAAEPVVVDLDVLSALGRAIGQEKLAHFLEGLSDQLKHMAAAMAAPTPDVGDLARQAHKVRGYAASLGYLDVGSRYRDLETACKEGAEVGSALAAARTVTDAALRDIDDRRAAA